jgi:hypothetical protein
MELKTPEPLFPNQQEEQTPTFKEPSPTKNSPLTTTSSSYLFKENKRKEQPKKQHSPKLTYLSNLSARRNPDMLLPHGKFLKGN